MYPRETVDRALALYAELGDMVAVCRAMGGRPSRSAIGYWVREAGLCAPRGGRSRVKFSADTKASAAARAAAGEGAPALAAEIGSAPSTVLNWKREYEKGGPTVFHEREAASASAPGPTEEELAAMPDDVGELKRELYEARFERDLAREVLAVLKKGPRVDPRSLSNREKAAVIDAMRGLGTYSLSCLASRMGIAPSSYHYARAAAAAPDRRAEARAAVVEEFEAGKRARGYRYVHERLRARGIRCGERTVRRLMAEEGLVPVYLKRPKRWSSYAGELSDAPENLVARYFRADAPDRLWLTDITEFKLEGGAKAYLSPVVDCFDGMLASWSIGPSPNAGLANSSLLKALDRAGAGARPVVHSDRGAHYRWPGWIAICEERGVTRSMSAKGCSPDNAACEGFFGRLKNEFFYGRDWGGVGYEEFARRLDEWLRYYNEERIKQSLGWMSPAQYRRSLGLVA